MCISAFSSKIYSGNHSKKPLSKICVQKANNEKVLLIFEGDFLLLFAGRFLGARFS
jgi:hypothetical protein